MSLKRAHSPSSPQTSIYQSSTITDQNSHFTAVFSPTIPPKTLQSRKEFETATHRILAWRRPSRQKTLSGDKPLYETGHDEDGEKWAGSRLVNVLKDLDVVGAVCVARWYGGVNIGPVRFTHIESVAKEAIWKFRDEEREMISREAGKRRKAEEEREKSVLIASLKERDENIAALRGLLAEKKARLEGGKVGPATPVREVGYEKMGLEALRRVDKARDKTVGFILKEMDRVDEELKALEAFDDVDEDALKEAEEKEKTDGATMLNPNMAARSTPKQEVKAFDDVDEEALQEVAEQETNGETSPTLKQEDNAFDDVDEEAMKEVEEQERTNGAAGPKPATPSTPKQGDKT
ncbi:hypothetical protein M011DRAFT_465903 [Sporormia fimetaria CBS 119925]|uniref:Impact N-terminal domain-containing protein n=1 Tax=Sporormia fimetaria CBS 119925 TaxID=1340428 RepID=A0A6A6VFS6_9PLEO|nr:hypothetical protein M011DRAFT_465903 [Sporormia fimetaria CBS 119925]